jgi:hypothetical protein
LARAADAGVGGICFGQNDRFKSFKPAIDGELTVVG